MNAWPSAMVAAWIVGIGANAWGAGQGLTVPADQPSWPRWQARVQLNSDAIATTSLTEQIQAFTAPRTRSAALFGDYFLANPWIGETGGLRLTSGLLVGQRGALLGPSGASQLVSNVAASISRMPVTAPGGADSPGEANLTWPYLGIGYSGSSLRGGWGFSADLGLAAQNPAALRLGRMTGSAGLDEWVRDMRLTPLLQLGVSYKF
jgi:hypothetical protein